MARERSLSYSRGYIEIWLSTPITHTTLKDGSYTTYLINLETNNRAFNLPKSFVRRRYNEFCWLRHRLHKHFPCRTIPELPKKTYLRNQFDVFVIEDRMLQLEIFLLKVTNESLFLADSALHLFLQTSLSIKEIDNCMNGELKTCVNQIILSQEGQMCSLPKEISPASIPSSISFARCVHQYQNSLYHAVISNEIFQKKNIVENRKIRIINEIEDDVIVNDGMSTDSESLDDSPPAVLHLERTIPVAFPSSSYSDQKKSRSLSCSHSDYFSYQSDTSLENSRDFCKLRKNVSFSNVTAAEIITKFNRTPRGFIKEKMPSCLIENTIAY